MDVRGLLEYLDGRGIVFEDESLVEEALYDISVALFDKLIICSPKIGEIWSGTQDYDQLIQEKVKHD